MALRLEDKKAIVAELSEKASSALSAVTVDYRGLTVNQMSQLRQEAREAGVYLRVVQNNLARLAVKGTEFECMADTFTGPTLLAFSKEEPGAAAKLIKAFADANKSVEVKHLAMSGELYGAEKLEEMAKLPSRDEAIALAIYMMKAPVEQFVKTLNEVPAQFVRVLSAVGEAKK